MSNRYPQGRQSGNKGFTKTQKVFIPKSQDQNQNSTPKESNQTPKLSTSMRQPLPNQSDLGTAIGCVTMPESRVRMGDKGEWVSNKAHGGNFVNYLPQDEAVAAGLGADEGGLDPVESQRVVDLLNRELSRLLKLSPREFWKEVARDTSLHEFLDSFLKFRSRWYDFPHHGPKGMVAGVIVGEIELSCRVFMVLYRISSNRDPGFCAADSLSPKDHGVILQEKKLLDLPKLLDICAIYGHENEDLTRALASNALRAQPWICNNITSVLSHCLSITHTMYQRCCSSLKTLFSSGSHRDQGFAQLYADMLEVMDFINDAIVSIDAFVSSYKPAAVFFSSPVEISHGNEELLKTLARLHDSLIPSMQRGFKIVLTSGKEGMVTNIGISLKMLSIRIINLGWKLLDYCYLSDDLFKDDLVVPAATKMFPANIEDPTIRGDILLQTFREISEASLSTQDNQNGEMFLQSIEKNFSIMRKLENLKNKGWMFMDNEQLGFLSVLLMDSKKSTDLPFNVESPVTNSRAQTDEDAAIMESKISQIKELFPDYGNGFIYACLEAYNQNPEDVIQRILEGNLHEDLQALDTSLEKMPIPKTAVTVSRIDKGKAKLTDISPNNNMLDVQRAEQNAGPSVSSSSVSVGRFVRKSKADMPDSETLDHKNKKDSARTAAILSQYEYDDEYDDSYDDLGLSVGDLGLDENEGLSDKISDWGKSFNTESENSSKIVPNSNWGSRKKPQFYVKDGKNYSYKVEGSVAVANANEASLVNQAQEDMIYGLGRGGNLPLGAVKKLMDASEEQDKQLDFSETAGRGLGNPRGRGRRGGGRGRDYKEEQDKQFGDSEVEGCENRGNYRGRGRGGGRNHYRKDRAMKKHFSGLSGY